MSLVGLVAAKPTADAYAPVYGYYTNPLAVASNQFHAQDEIGQYNYGYSNQVFTMSHSTVTHSKNLTVLLL